MNIGLEKGPSHVVKPCYFQEKNALMLQCSNNLIRKVVHCEKILASS